MLRYRPWKYTKYSPRALPCLTQFFLGKNGSALWKKRLNLRDSRFRLPLWCASSLACTFRSPVLIRSFCLRVFAFPFGSAIRGLSRVIHPGMIQFFGQRAQERPLPGCCFLYVQFSLSRFCCQVFFLPVTACYFPNISCHSARFRVQLNWKAMAFFFNLL